MTLGEAFIGVKAVAVGGICGEDGRWVGDLLGARHGCRHIDQQLESQCNPQAVHAARPHHATLLSVQTRFTSVLWDWELRTSGVVMHGSLRQHRVVLDLRFAQRRAVAGDEDQLGCAAVQ